MGAFPAVTGAVDDGRVRKGERADGRALDLPEAEEAAVGGAAVPLSNQMLMRAMTQPGDALEREAESGGPIPGADRGGGLLPRAVVETLGGAGGALDGATMAAMQMRFGRDLSGVRVHTGGAADRSAKQ